MAFSVKVLADSVGPNEARLTTVEVTLPRIVLSELLTHRVFSRNSASSRAIPIERMIQRVLHDPFVPEYWGANQKGMQAVSEISAACAEEGRHRWLMARDKAVTEVKNLMALGVHKQIANRLLEPFAWTTVIITATEWDNFFALRCHRDAQPELRRAAEMIRAARDESRVTRCARDQMHMPMCEDYGDLRYEGYSDTDVSMIVAGRCARISYLTHDGKRNPRADLELATRLLQSGHMSPFEHVAYASEEKEWFGNFYGWRQMRKGIENENIFRGDAK